MKSLAFYFTYAWRSVQRGGQRTFFAILCVAVGVASIVALQSTGLAIQDAVAGDARANAKADVVVSNAQLFFTKEDLAKFDTLKQQGKIVDYTTSVDNAGVTALTKDGKQSNSFGSYYLALIIDPTKYPFYGKVELENPKGKSLKDLLVKPNQIVVNSKMATSLGVKVGDKYNMYGEKRLGSAEIEIVGILTSNTPAPGGQADFTGYGYISAETAAKLFDPANILPVTVYVKTQSNKEANTLAKNAITEKPTTFKATTSEEYNENLKKFSGQLNNVLSYVGLLSLLIGSVGVVNTMLVVVGRRSGEIATIKALGMEGSQTVLVFVLEAAILGLGGSIVGIVLGLLGSFAVAQAAQGFVGRELAVGFYWQPVIIGLIVGVFTAIIFGLLPAYSASKIPPAQVLRQKTNNLPKISLGAALLIIGLMTLLMGTLVGVVLNGQFVTGIIVAFATLIICSLLVLSYAGLLWTIEKIPMPFGLNYKMARRNLSRGRAKAAITTLVMTVGIFSVALVFILSSSLKDTISVTLEKSFGYNLQVAAQNPAQAEGIKNSLKNNEVPGLQKYLEISQANVRMVSAGGASVNELLDRQAKREEERKKNPTADPDGGPLNPVAMAMVSGMDFSKANELIKIKQGQLPTAPDEVTIDKSLVSNFGLKVGDELVYLDLASQKQFSLKVTGVHEPKNFLLDSAPVLASNARVQAMPGSQTTWGVMIDKKQVDAAEIWLKNKFAGAEVVNLSFITAIFNRLIDQVTAFPVLLALLSLIAGTILIANNVALAVLERRTEMGVMKSLGADSGRVLTILNVETGIVGFVGGAVGLFGASIVAAVAVFALGTPDDPAILSISPWLSLGMLALAVGLAVAATIASAWNAAREKPLVVLRYE